jgi:hypothetical protein
MGMPIPILKETFNIQSKFINKLPCSYTKLMESLL